MTSMGRATRASLSAYDVSALPDDRIDELPAGSNLLVAGPSLMGKSRLALTALPTQPRDDRRSIVVTSEKNADQLLTELDTLGLPGDDEDFYVIDCSGTSGRGSFEETANVKYVNSPNDLTGIGVGVAKCMNEIGDAARNGLGIGVLSLSTLLQYASEERVFNFAHITTGRVSAGGYLGVWTLDTESHAPQTVNTIRGQFDYVAELREVDSGEREMRILGGEPDWRTWEGI